MAKFRFQLQPVLDHRIAIERDRMRVLGELERDRLRLEARLLELRDSAATEREDLRAALAGQAGPVDLTRVRLQAHAGFRCANEEHRVVLALAGVLERITRARQLLLEATTRRKGVELLKEKRYQEWREDQNRREDALLDEIAVTRASAAGDRL
jgi:flagellar export protein FliJ